MNEILDQDLMVRAAFMMARESPVWTRLGFDAKTRKGVREIKRMQLKDTERASISRFAAVFCATEAMIQSLVDKGSSVCEAVESVLPIVVDRFSHIFFNSSYSGSHIAEIVFRYLYSSFSLWRDKNFPTVVLSDEALAVHRLSDFSFECVQGLSAPWPSFRIIRSDRPTSFILCSILDGAFFYANHRIKGYQGIFFAETNKLKSFDALEEEIRPEIAGALMMIADTQLNPSALQKSKGCIRKRKSKTPMSNSFVFTKDVKIKGPRGAKSISAREIGNREHPMYQYLVRGHYKKQVCGKGRKERKIIHVEPYWRGPEDAPIAVRSHVIEKS